MIKPPAFSRNNFDFYEENSFCGDFQVIGSPCSVSYLFEAFAELDKLKAENEEMRKAINVIRKAMEQANEETE